MNHKGAIGAMAAHSQIGDMAMFIAEPYAALNAAARTTISRRQRRKSWPEMKKL